MALPSPQTVETGKQIVDWFSVGVVVGVAVEILPSIATLLTIVWLAIRVWESDTVRGWTGRRLAQPSEE